MYGGVRAGCSCCRKGRGWGKREESPAYLSFFILLHTSVQKTGDYCCHKMPHNLPSSSSCYPTPCFCNKPSKANAPGSLLPYRGAWLGQSSFCMVRSSAVLHILALGIAAAVSASSSVSANPPGTGILRPPPAPSFALQPYLEQSRAL